jgi:hypothetical protein
MNLELKNKKFCSKCQKDYFGGSFAGYKKHPGIQGVAVSRKRP